MPFASSKLHNSLIKQNISMTKYSRGKRAFEDSKGLIRRCNLETDRKKQWIKRTVIYKTLNQMFKS
jgi:hypothetical protein